MSLAWHIFCCCLDQLKSTLQLSGNGYREHGSRLTGFKPLIPKPKPYRDIPDSDDSETEEFNINVSRNDSRAYRTQQQHKSKWNSLWLEGYSYKGGWGPLENSTHWGLGEELHPEHGVSLSNLIDQYSEWEFAMSVGRLPESDRMGVWILHIGTNICCGPAMAHILASLKQNFANLFFCTKTQHLIAHIVYKVPWRCGMEFVFKKSLFLM